MKNLNYVAELDITDVVRNMLAMEETVQKGNISISKTIDAIKLTYENMSSILTSNSTCMAASIAQVSASTNATESAIKTMSDTCVEIGNASEYVSLLSNTFQNTSGFVDNYTQKIVEANIQSGGTMNGFSMMDMILQDMSKNMDLASISTSIANLAMSAMNDPVSFLTQTIGGLVLGLGSLSLMADANYQTLEKNKFLVDESTLAVQKDVDANNALQASYEKQIQGNLALVDNTQRLFDQLTTIVDVNGEVKDGFSGTAEFILGELNSALGTNYQIVDGVIQGYGNLTGSIDQSVDRMKAEAILETQKKAYSDAIFAMGEATSKVVEQENLLVQVKSENGKIIQDAEKGITDAILNNQDELVDGYKKQIEEAKNNIAEQEANVEAQKTIVKDKVDAIALYEDNAAAYAEGRFQDVKTRQDEAISEDTQGQLEAYQSRYDNLKVQRDAYLANGDEKRAEQVQKEIDEELLNAQKMLETKGINNETELGALGTFISDKQARLTEMYATDESNWTEAQRKEAESLKASIDSGLTTYSGYADSKVNKAVELTGKLSANSTQQEIDAALAAQREAQDTLAIMSSNVGDKMDVLADLKRRRGENDASVTDAMVAEAQRQADLAKTEYERVAEKTITAMKDKEDEVPAIGKNYTEGFVNGTQSLSDKAASAGLALGDSFMTALRNAGLVKSPSKKTKEIGNYYGEGFTLGMEQSKKDVEESASDLAQTALDEFSDFDGRFESAINQVDMHSVFGKMKSAIANENARLSNEIKGSVLNESHINSKVAIDIPEIKGTISGKIENHLEIDGRETAIQLTPFISEELAFSSH